MKAQEIEIGNFYVAKVSGKPAIVQVLTGNAHRAYRCRNVKTNRIVTCKTAKRFRYRVYPCRGCDLSYVTDPNAVCDYCSHDGSNFISEKERL